MGSKGSATSPTLTSLNLTRHTILGDAIVVADTSLSRFVGLLGRRGLAAGEGLLIRPSNGVHTLGMRFAIDVLLLTKDGSVLCAYSNLRPFRITAVKWQATSALELPAGTIAASGTAAGDQISFESALPDG
jgi:hypothetical protein